MKRLLPVNVSQIGFRQWLGKLVFLQERYPFAFHG